MTLAMDDVGLLLADTMRSRAYAQALAQRDATVGSALVVRSPDRRRWGQAPPIDTTGAHVPGLVVPDLSVPLSETLPELTDNLASSNAGTINHPDVTAWIEREDPALVVFSGFGGEIVRDEVLDAGPPLLHLHSGWLPDYRGSTTLYYSYLREGTCGVTALLLESDIDTGPILARRRYPAPPPDLDIDYAYDSAIRADLLVDVLEQWSKRGGRLETMPQPEGGTTYYIIHPVLKHLAMIDMGQEPT